MFRKTLLIICLLRSVAFGEFQHITFPNVQNPGTLEIILRERLSYEGNTFTFRNGLTLDNATNNAFEWNENSEELIWTFATNAVNLSSGTGVVSMDFATIVTKHDQILLDPISAPVGTVEGTLYYDSDTDKLTYRNSSSFISLPGSSAAGGSNTEIQFNSTGTLDGISTVIWDGTNFEFADDQSVAFGTAADWTVNFDDSVDDQLLWLTAATTASAITDPLFEIIVGAVPTADQEVFGVSKGTQVSNTSLLALDEDGDMTIAGNFFQTAIASAASGNVNITIDAAGTGTMTIGGISTGLISMPNANLDIGDAATDKLSVVSEIDTNLTLDDDTTDSPALILSDAGDNTATFIKKNGATGNTEITIGATSDIEIVAGNLAVGNGSPGSAAMDGEDFYVNGDSEFDGAVQFDGLPTGAAGLTITGAAVNLNVSSNFAINVATGTSTGTVTVGGNGIQTINIGDGAAAKTVTLGSSNSTSTTTLLSGSGGLNLNASNNQPTNLNTGNSTGATTIGNALSDISLLGHIQGATAFILDGATDNSFETSIAVTDPTADIIWTFPDGAADTLAFMGSTLTTNYPEIANSVTGGTNQLIFEGSDADTEETIITATDPTADIIWTLADGGAQTVAFVPSTLATNFVDVVNSVWTGTNQLIFEGTDADTEETVITVTDATADNTFTFADDSGLVAYTADGGKTTLSGAGAIPLTDAIVEWTTTGSNTGSLADGKPGQILTVVIVTDGGEGTIVPDTTFTGWATAVLTDDIDTITFFFADTTSGWVIMGTAAAAGNAVAVTQ